MSFTLEFFSLKDKVPKDGEEIMYFDNTPYGGSITSAELHYGTFEWYWVEVDEEGRPDGAIFNYDESDEFDGNYVLKTTGDSTPCKLHYSISGSTCGPADSPCDRIFWVSTDLFFDTLPLPERGR